MYIGYCQNVKFSYTRVGGKHAFDPEILENGEKFFKWDRIYNAGLEIHAELDKEYYVGSLTLPLVGNARVCGIKVFSRDGIVGVYSAGTGCAKGGKITVEVGVFTDNLTVRIETGADDVCFTDPEIFVCRDDGAPFVWPVPKKAEYFDGTVKISRIVGAGDDAEFAADYLSDLLSRRFGDVLSSDGVPVTLVISEDESYQHERYTVSVTKQGIILTAARRLTLLYAAHTLLSLYSEGGFRLCEIDNAPSKEFRGYHMGLPRRVNLEFAKRLFREILLPLGYNTLFVQIIAAMEFDRHPEITEAWARELAVNPKFQHHYMGCEGETISKKEVAELMDYARELGFEIIPEVQSLSHIPWLTLSHPEIGEVVTADRAVDDTRDEDERPELRHPFCYCPSNEKTYELLFDVMDEIIEVTKPQRFVHIGHDEVYYMGLCDKCKDTPHDVLFARDVNRIYNHLKELGYRTMMWSDMIQPVTKYQTPGAIKMLPKDIVMLDFIWYFHLDKDIEENLYPEGYDVIGGNLYSSHFPRYNKRAKAEKFIGGEVSSWCAVSEYRMGKKGKFFDLTYTAEMLWNPENYDDGQRRVFSHLISKYIQPVQRDLIRGKYNVSGYEKTDFSLPAGVTKKIPRELLAAYPHAIIADGAEVKIGGAYERFVIEHTTLEREMRVPWQELKLSGEYTLCYADGSKEIVRAEYAGGVMHYNSAYGYPLPEAVHRHTGYVGTWFADPVYEGKTEHGEELLVLGYVVENPHPEKEVEKITYQAAETDISVVVLCGIKGLNPND